MPAAATVAVISPRAREGSGRVQNDGGGSRKLAVRAVLAGDGWFVDVEFPVASVATAQLQ